MYLYQVLFVKNQKQKNFYVFSNISGNDKTQVYAFMHVILYLLQIHFVSCCQLHSLQWVYSPELPVDRKSIILINA